MRWNRSINGVPIVKWHNGNYELDAARDLVSFGSKCYIITKADVKKQLQMRTEKDPQKYMGIMVDENVLPEHCDGYFVGYAAITPFFWYGILKQTKCDERIMRTWTSFASASYRLNN